MQKIMVICLIFVVGCTLTTEEVAKRNEYLERAQTYYRGKKYMNALQQIELALEIDAYSKRAIVSKAWTLFYLNKNDRAEKWFVKAHEMDNADVWTHQGLAAVYFKRGMSIGKRLDKTLLEISNVDENQQKAKEKEINQTINKQRQEAELWFEKSLTHYQDAIDFADEGQDLYNMLASVHSMIALPYYSDASRSLNEYQETGETSRKESVGIFVEKGLPNYEKALGYLEKYIKFTNEELIPIEKYLADKKAQREKVGLLEDEHAKLDRQVEFFELQRQVNRKRNRIAQGFAGDTDYKIAVLMKKAEEQTQNEQESSKYRTLFKKHITLAKNRIFDMVRDFPEMKSGARNLANIAKLEGDYKTAMKYLEEYINKNPMIRPIEKVEVQEEMELLNFDQKN
ncbi:tetratricopeptide repeat protein [Candidatus Uabimicrobium sp. HlEnr_7]|uniref:tetratricopeptide repeat protein n=1 Tax=Candidatus Uabimicrobium helgolandensis TaxID=3095367 RepID=UPI00355868DA